MPQKISRGIPDSEPVTNPLSWLALLALFVIFTIILLVDDLVHPDESPNLRI
jgi:hypothetical protein